MELFKSRPRVVYTNAVGDKVYPVVVDIKKGIKSTEDIQFVSSDVNTGILSVAFIQGNDNYNVTGANVVCSVMRPDASTLELPCEVVGENIVEVPLGINGTSQDGVYSFDFKVFKGENKVVGTPIMNYSVSLSISNDMVVEEDDRLPVLTVLMTQLTELKDEAREVINQANVATESSKEATANAIEATNNANATINTANQKMLEVDNAKNEMTATVTNKVNEVEGRFNALTASQQQSSEVIDARDGETSLKARLDRDLYKDGISLSDRIEAIEGLKDSQNMKYETDKGYLVCKETKNGVIDDMKLEGKTLATVLTCSTNKNYTKWAPVDCVSYKAVEVGKVYTIIAQTNNTAQCGLKNRTSNDYLLALAAAEEFICKTITFSKAEELVIVTDTEGTVNMELMILEGDHTQNPPSYFEGLMSVGQDVDKIEVLSSNENLLNLVDLGYSQKGNYLNIEYMNTNSIKFNTLSENTFPYASVSFDSFKFIPNIRYRLKAKCTQGNSTNTPFISIRQYKNYGSALKDIYAVNGVIEGTFIPTHTNHRIDIYGGNQKGPLGGTWVEYTDIQLSIDNSDFNYFTPHQSDKKQILFYNENGELEPVAELHEWDSIEKHSDNKWYYHKRSGKVVLNGSESIYTMNIVGANTNYASIHIPRMRVSNNLPLVCDKFKCEAYASSKDYEYIYTWVISNNPYVYINFSKDKGTTKEEFKQWLQTNNVTIVYQLAEEEVYELAPLHLDSYANETLILCNSGAISPKMEFSITSHINNLVLSNTKRINALEEKVFSALKQVLAGDMYSLAELLYPEDFVEENPENEIMLLPFE